MIIRLFNLNPKLFVMNSLTDKVVVITGASSGIGESCALSFSKQGAKVVLAARSTDKINVLAKRIGSDNAMAVTVDVSSEQQVNTMVQQVIERFGQVDVLINNAGVGIKGSVVDAPLEEFDQVLRTNFHGVLYGIRAVYPVMKKKGGGTIVNVSSVAGFKGFYDSGLYSASKFAVNGLSESLGEDARKDNIHVLLVCPGKVETEFENNVIYRDEPCQNKRTGISADEVAHAIIEGVQKKRKMIVIGKKCVPLYLLNRLSPRLTNYIIRYIY